MLRYWCKRTLCKSHAVPTLYATRLTRKNWPKKKPEPRECPRTEASVCVFNVSGASALVAEIATAAEIISHLRKQHYMVPKGTVRSASPGSIETLLSTSIPKTFRHPLMHSHPLPLRTMDYGQSAMREVLLTAAGSLSAMTRDRAGTAAWKRHCKR